MCLLLLLGLTVSIGYVIMTYV